MVENKQLEYGKWAILVAVVLVLWTILKKFGIVGDKTTEEIQEDEATDLNLTIDFKEYTSPNFWKKTPPTGKIVALFSMKITDEIVEGLYDSFAFTQTSILTMGLVQDDEEKMLANIKKINYKTQYSWIADRYEKLHEQDLTATLKKYFSEEELYPAWKHLDSIPTYANKK